MNDEENDVLALPWVPEPKNKIIKRKNKEGRKVENSFFLPSLFSSP